MTLRSELLVGRISSVVFVYHVILHSMLSLLEGHSYLSIKVLAYSTVSHGFIALFSMLHCRDVIPLHSGQHKSFLKEHFC